MPYTAIDRQRIRLRAKHQVGLIKKDAQDKFIFLEQCIADLEDQGVDEAEQICSLLWDEQGGDY